MFFIDVLINCLNFLFFIGSSIGNYNFYKLCYNFIKQQQQQNRSIIQEFIVLSYEYTSSNFNDKFLVDIIIKYK